MLHPAPCPWCHPTAAFESAVKSRSGGIAGRSCHGLDTTAAVTELLRRQLQAQFGEIVHGACCNKCVNRPASTERELAQRAANVFTVHTCAGA